MYLWYFSHRIWIICKHGGLDFFSTVENYFLPALRWRPPSLITWIIFNLFYFFLISLTLITCLACLICLTSCVCFTCLTYLNCHNYLTSLTHSNCIWLIITIVLVLHIVSVSICLARDSRSRHRQRVSPFIKLVLMIEKSELRNLVLVLTPPLDQDWEIYWNFW